MIRYLAFALALGELLGHLGLVGLLRRLMLDLGLGGLDKLLGRGGLDELLGRSVLDLGLGGRLGRLALGGRLGHLALDLEFAQGPELLGTMRDGV